VPSAIELHLIVRVPVKAGERGFIEQAILSDVFLHNDFLKKSGSRIVAADNDIPIESEPGQ
jgi:hypothetical protein